MWLGKSCCLVTRIGEDSHPGPPKTRDEIGQWHAQRILAGQHAVTVNDCNVHIKLPCAVKGGCKKHRDQWAKNAATRIRDDGEKSGVSSTQPNFDDREQIPVVGRLKVVLQNVQSLTTVGTGALQDDATVHIWPEANVLVRGEKVMRKLFKEAAQALHFSIPMDARVATGRNDVNLEYKADRQSRLAIAVAKPTTGVTLAIDKDDNETRRLLDSGRWVEVLVPIGDGTKHMVVAGFY